MSPFEHDLRRVAAKVKRNTPLSDHTTMRIGGPADYLVEATNSEQLVKALRLCREQGIPHRLLGGGSNVIVSDKGFRGVIIINRDTSWQILDKVPADLQLEHSESRYEIHGSDYGSPQEVDYSDEDAPPVLVRASAGLRIVPWMKELFDQGITGLQWYAGIPATIGGSIFMNMHGGHHFFGDIVFRAELFDGEKARWEPQKYFNFNYDWSILHNTREIILRAELVLRKGDPLKAREQAKKWARSKSQQPQRSAGCIFQNLNPDQQQKLKLDTPSVGYVVDKLLGLKGVSCGDAVIAPSHAAFIVNKGKASATDVYYLYKRIQDASREKLGIELQPEVEFIGDFE